MVMTPDDTAIAVRMPNKRTVEHNAKSPMDSRVSIRALVSNRCIGYLRGLTKPFLGHSA